MPSFCAAFNCSNRSDRDRKSFFRIPNLPNRACEGRRTLIAIRRQKWLDALKRSDLTEKKIPTLRICEDHFISGKPADLRDLSSPDWVPSLNMGYEKRGAYLYQSPRKNISSSDERRKGFWRKKLLLDGEIDISISEAANSQSEVENLMEMSLIEFASFQSPEKFSIENTCALDTSVIKWISSKSNQTSEIYEDTLNKENKGMNLIVEQNLSSVKETFTYESLVNNLALIKKPNEFWAISSLSDVVICARWGEDYACEKRVVIEKPLTVKVYVKGWQINLSELLVITCLDDISNLLGKVESYKMVKLEVIE